MCWLRLPPLSLSVDRPKTSESFLAWEDRQECKFEFDGRRVIPMTGGSIAHLRIVANVWPALMNLPVRLRCVHSRPRPSSMPCCAASVSIPTGRCAFGGVGTADAVRTQAGISGSSYPRTMIPVVIPAKNPRGQAFSGDDESG